MRRAFASPFALASAFALAYASAGCTKAAPNRCHSSARRRSVVSKSVVDLFRVADTRRLNSPSGRTWHRMNFRETPASRIATASALPSRARLVPLAACGRGRSACEYQGTCATRPAPSGETMASSSFSVRGSLPTDRSIASTLGDGRRQQLPHRAVRLLLRQLEGRRRDDQRAQHGAETRLVDARDDRQRSLLICGCQPTRAGDAWQERRLRGMTNCPSAQ